jgi:hypothetical protein
VFERASAGDRFRTFSEEWHAEVRRRARHLGWHLEFRLADEPRPALRYKPRTALPGGRLAGMDGHHYRLRGPFLRADWSVEVRPTRQTGQIAFRTSGRVADYSKFVRFGDRADDEPLLLALMLAASVAILVHADEPRFAGPHP